MAATIVDVARRAGVSTATVSRVMSGAAVARPATRDRVLAAVRELDYSPSAVARALKRRETRTLGLLVTDIANPFFPLVVRAVEGEAHARGYGVVFGNAADDPERELAYLDLLLERRVDGLIVASARATRRHAERLARVPVPVVLLNSDAPGTGALPSIATDHRLGGRLGAEHLLGLGHRSIAHVTAPIGHAAAALDRRLGIGDAMRTAGIDPATLLVVDGGGTVEGGAAAVPALLSATPRPTAVIGFNDLTAIGLLRGFRAAGLRVPEDTSVVGFDDIELAAWTDPPLTTVRQPTEELGRWAVTRIADVLADAERPGGPSRVILEPTLVVRGTTAPPHGAV
jgi:LacI family transcriptional regulator